MTSRNRTRHLIRCLCVVVASAACAADESEGVPFLQEHCVKCHNAEKHKGNVRLDELGFRVNGDSYKLWEEIVHNIQRGDMPPENEKQPLQEERQEFLKKLVSLMAKYEADSQSVREPFMRLTNRQIAHSLQDLLSTHENIADKLIGDPIDKHGYSRRSELDFSGAHLELYARALEGLISRAVPDPAPGPANVFRIAGNDWEKCHWAGDNYLYQGYRRLYEGPEWIGDNFKIPLPPKHEFRMFLHDNRSEGRFRIRLTLRNEPPTNGGPLTPQEMAVYLDHGEEEHYKLVQAFQVPAKEGVQQFEMFGDLADYLGVVTNPIVEGDHTPGYWLAFRTLTIVNHNELVGFPLPGRFLTTEPIYLVRSDDQWIKAFGGKPGLIASADGNNGRHGNEASGKPVYPEAIKTHGHVILEKVEFEVPYYQSWPPEGERPFLTDGHIVREKLPAMLAAFAAKAWRRPLSAEDTAHLEKLVAEELAAGPSEMGALRNSLITILSDPRFLYVSQAGNHGLASRLSCFLWNGPPDATLTALAGQKEPIDDATLKREVDRLLADERSKRFVDDFVARWIGFNAFDQTAIDPNYYPNFRLRARDYMKQESVEFFSEILRNDLSCLNFLESDFVMMNGWLAEHYGIPGVSTQRFVRIPAPPERGGGVLAQGAFLLAYSTGQDAHAVNRGVWVRSHLLGDPPSDPPPDIPTLGAQGAGEEGKGPLSIKQKLERHLTTGTTCYDCHKDIDHWGIPLEGFDAVGLPRTNIVKAGPVVRDVEIAGRKIDGLLTLKNYLLEERSQQFAYGFTRHMLSYALGRPMNYKDEEQVVDLQKTFEASGYRMKDLIRAIVVSPAFRNSH